MKVLYKILDLRIVNYKKRMMNHRRAISFVKKNCFDFHYIILNNNE